MLKSLPTLVQELTLSVKDLKPFWNQQSQEIASCFTLPTKTDFVDLGTTSLNGLSPRQVVKSWFKTRIAYHPNRSLPEIYSQSCTFFPVECTVLETTAARLIRLSPTATQRIIFRKWTDGSRFVYNWTCDYIRSCMNFAPTWMDIKKDMHNALGLPKWCEEIPFQVKAIAIKEACESFWKTNGRFNFRSRKEPEQSCYIPKSAIKDSGIYPRLSGKNLKYLESLPEQSKDSRLIWRANKWWISIPENRTIQRSENQANRIVAIDPGVRTFASFYSPDFSGKIGEGDFTRIYRLLLHLDKLYSKRSNKGLRKWKSYTKAIRRLSEKIKNLISELHWKVARFFCENFSVILLPSYETSQMVSKIDRKIKSKTVRSMLGFASYKFKQKLNWVAKKFGKTVIEMSEAYTSKTHPETGKIKNIGSAKFIKLTNGSMADRDIVGACNILVKFLTKCCTLGDTPIIG